jgi:saccharopine dehydrogenase-like NADP-dependent oxidoreductase
LGPIFQKNNLLSLTGCGSVPGTGNVMLGYTANKFDKIYSIEAGFAYKSNINKFVVPFSILSVIEEFTEPAPILKNGHIIYKIPLENTRKAFHRGIGIQEEFLVNHAEIYTFHHYFKHKGLKNIKFYASFPEVHYKTVLAFIETGLGSKEPVISLPGFNKKLAPVTFLSQALKQIETPDGYRETENLWLKIHGKKDGKSKEILMECLVPTLKGWEEDYANIDTGMPISIMAQMIKNGIIENKGSFSPEVIVPPEPYFKELRKRKMVIYENGKIIN